MARPTLYRDTYPEQARKLCLLGATTPELADFFGVNQDTVVEWQKAHPEFAEAVRSGKDQADAEVANRLYCRALGYSHEAVKIFADTKTGKVTQVSYTERFPPDTTACIFWLKNRQRAKWRDKPDEGGDGTPPSVAVTGGLPE